MNNLVINLDICRKDDPKNCIVVRGFLDEIEATQIRQIRLAIKRSRDEGMPFVLLIPGHEIRN